MFLCIYGLYSDYFNSLVTLTSNRSKMEYLHSQSKIDVDFVNWMVCKAIECKLFEVYFTFDVFLAINFHLFSILYYFFL